MTPRQARRSRESHPGSLRIGSIRGIALNLHFSLIFLMAYVIFVAAVQFPAVVYRSGVVIDAIRGGPFLWGVIFALGLFSSVVLHEFGHALVAQAQGVRVRAITLMMLGGVSEMDHIPEQPYHEFKMALIGPLVSLVLALILGAIRAGAHSPNLSLFCFWLGNANLVLAIFNLLPAFPLDGGRALRSFLAVREGMMRATQSAVRVSKAVAWVIGIWGLLQFNILLMLIALFIHTAAQAELTFLITRGMLHGFRVADVMVRTAAIAEHDTLQLAAMQMLESRNYVLPVRTASDTPALVSYESMRSVERSAWPLARVSVAMVEASKVLSPLDPLDQALPEITEGPIQALPVMQGTEIVGVVKYADLADYLRYRGLQGTEESKAA